MSTSLQSLQKEINYDKTFNCVQCGYCLPVCPTYLTMGKETHSPRGRINLIKMVGEGKIKNIEDIEESINLCLGCRACETACPTGVEYGSLLEATRAAIMVRKKPSLGEKFLKETFLKKVIPNKKVMNFTRNSYWLYEKSLLQKVVRTTGLTKLVSNNLGVFESIAPKAISPKNSKKLKSFTASNGETKYKVAFFTGCIMDALFRQINILSVKLLAKAGCEVTIVDTQTCCGALHAHAGEMDEARSLAKINLSAFDQDNFDFIVNNAGGCGAALKEYPHLLKDDPEWHEKAQIFANKSKDISQILILCGGFSKVPERNEIVTYQPSCHMTNVQKVIAEPKALIKSIPGITFIEMPTENSCCGSAGIYNIVNYKESMEILDGKMKEVKKTLATVLLTTNPGCLLQMKLGIEREGLSSSMRALHIVEYLAEVLGVE